MEDYRSKSFWLESLPQTITPNPGLSGSKKTNVVVIGGGYTGLSTGYHLKQLQPGLEVSVLESDICGYGASGRNGGFSMTLFGLTKGITKFRFNDKKAHSAQAYMEDAVDYLHDFIELNQIDCDYEKSGYLLVGTSPAQVKRIEHDFKIMEDWGLKGVEHWDRNRLKDEFNTSFYKIGWFEKRCGILNPARLAREMKRLAQEKGVVIYENSPVTDFKKLSSSKFLVKTGKGEITADYLVFATNAYSILFPQLKSIQRPVFTHIVMTEPLSDYQLDAIGWKNRAGIEDARDLIHYYRLTKDNRIVMGGGDVSLGYGSQLNRDLNEKTFSHLQNHVLEIFPQLKGIRFTHKWGGPVSVTLDMTPVIGYLGENKKAIFSMGCLGHGVSMTFTNGRAIAEMICKKETQRTQMFFMGRKIIPWPPDLISYGAAHAIRGFMKMEDAILYK